MTARVPIVVTILSRNRGPFLRETIRSFLSQTMRPVRIVVLDNASGPATVEVAQSFVSEGVEVDRSDTLISVAENFARARAHATEPWIMIAHDDDLYHPEYLQTAVGALQLADPQAGICITGMTFEFAPTSQFEFGLRANAIRRLTHRELALTMYNGYPVNFGGTIYHRDVLCRVKPDWQRFANLFDRPFLLECTREGGALMLAQPSVKYRVHAGQDVRNAAKALPASYACNLISAYGSVLRPPFAKGPDPFARRTMYLLSQALRNEYPGMFSRFRFMVKMRTLRGTDWIWGTLCYPWYFCRYRAAIWRHRVRERITRCA